MRFSTPISDWKRGFCSSAGQRQFVETAIDRRRLARHEEIRGDSDQRGAEEEREHGHHRGHGYTSILTTCWIQKYPMVCITTVAPSIMWPIRSVNSSCMCSGLMNISAMARNTGNPSST